MEALIIAFDGILVITSFWMIFVVRKIQMGGVLGNTLYSIAIGAIVLGIAHALESIMFSVFNMDQATVELIHRLVVFLGFVLLIYGFQQLARLTQNN